MQPPGIEPGAPAWQAEILPLNYGCSCWVGLGPGFDGSAEKTNSIYIVVL